MKSKSSIEGGYLQFLFKASGRSRFDLDLFLEQNAKRLYCLLRVLLHGFEHLKFQVALNVKLGRQTLTEEGLVSIRPWFVNNAQTCYGRRNKDKRLKALKGILQIFYAFLEEGRGFMEIGTSSINETQSRSMQAFWGVAHKPNSCMLV